ncbi:MAG: DUF2971 domain-containing protein [Elusimicrobiaceae bacterium]|nr:DUF2971 domain-containing protein [Elusimicrobiaceae bacterium]
MKYNYKESTIFETLISIDEHGNPGLYFCGIGKESSFIPPQEDEPDVVYHYCSVESALKIISTQTIWLADLFQTNDCKEVKWFFELFYNHVKSLSLKTSLEIQKITCLYRIFRLNIMWGFTACFTSIKDSSIHWGEYGNEGRGVAIGIRPKNIEITRGLPERHAQGECQKNSIAFIQVNYDEESQKNLIKEIINEVLYSNLSVQTAGFALAKMAYTCKTHNWSEEKEWRILYTPLEMQTGSFPKSNNSLVSSIQNLNSTKKHADFYLSTDIFSEVILGPKCHLSPDEFNQQLPINFRDKITQS